MYLSKIDFLNKFFDCIYLVTIERSWNKRKERIFKNLEGINFFKFEGLDGKKMSLSEIESITDQKRAREFLDYFHLLRYRKLANRNLTPSEVGCTASHNMIYKDIIQKDYVKILILEDDAMLWPPGIKLFQEMVQQLPPDWDIWYLGYRWHDCESKIAYWKRKFLLLLKFLQNSAEALQEEKRQSIIFPKYHTRNIWKAGLHAGTHAYAITSRAAKILLKENEPIYLPADMALAHLHLKGILKAYISVPHVFREDQSFETTVLNQ